MIFPAYQGDVAVRDAALLRLIKYVLSKPLQNSMLSWDGESGSVAGVLGETSDAAEWETRLGLPKWLAFAMDTLGGRLDKTSVGELIAILQAFPVGRNVASMGSLFTIRLLEEIASVAPPKDGLADALQVITDLHQRCVRGDEVSPAEWRKARQAAVRSTEELGPEPDEDGPPLPHPVLKARGVALSIEAAAWDPSRSPSVVSEVLRQWLNLEGLKSDEEFGWTATEDKLTRARLNEMYEKHIANHPDESRSVFDFLALEYPETDARMKAYEAHGRNHGKLCAERACRLLASFVAAA